MSKRNIKLYVKDILEAIKAIEKFVEGMDFESFKEDDKTSSAVIRKFEIIGEVTKKYSSEHKRKISAYPMERDGRFPRQTYTFLLWYKIRYCMGHHTDLPYYDNVPYADLSDFFYVWLKRSVGG